MSNQILHYFYLNVPKQITLILNIDNPFLHFISHGTSREAWLAQR